MTLAIAREKLAETGRLIIPAGTMEFRGPHLPLGTDSIILDHLADDLSARTGVPRAPVIPFGVRGRDREERPGVAHVSRKSLHRIMNELIAAWEEVGGVRDIVVLTANAAEAHQEALSTIRTIGSVRSLDIFGFDFSSLTTGDGPVHGGQLDTSLMLFLHPELVAPGYSGEHQGDAERGRRLYAFILERLVARCFSPARMVDTPDQPQGS
ncbi:MAG: creatininase family protein [Gemmatimonadota bacterium]